MRRSALSLGGWLAAVCSVASVAWACGSAETNPFGKGSRGEQGGSGGTDPGSGGTSGTSAGTDTGGSGTGGASGTGTGGEATGGMTTGGGTGDGGAAAESGNDTGGTMTGGTMATGGAAGVGMGGSGGAGAGAGGAGAGSSGASPGGAGAGAGGAGMSGSGGMPGDCKLDTDCTEDEYCKKASCDAESGHCTERGPECRGDDAEFDPVCGCDGITYWNTCTIEHEGFNAAMAGECTGNNRPTCTRAAGGDSCPERLHAHCYRPVEMCGDPSPTTGFCWVLPTECPENEPQTERYCGGTDPDGPRCIGLCEVIDFENSFRRDAPTCN